MTVEIVILAMIAAFLGLRLYSVLGRRAEHKEEPIPGRFEGQPDAERKSHVPPPAQPEEKVHPFPGMRQPEVPVASPGVERGLREIAAADRRFDALAFAEGSRVAYRMILEAYWRGDKEELRQLCDDDVYDSFAAAIDARAQSGEVMDNRLVRIEDTAMTGAGMEGQTARITMRFRSDIAAVTRDADGNVIAGSLDDAIEAVDVWTFARDIRSADPDWLLVETDEG